eukprot:13788938-Alexandrium_andersonii.AAC.1
MPTLLRRRRTEPAHEPATAWTHRPATVAMGAIRSQRGRPRPTMISCSQSRAMRSKALLWSARTRTGQPASGEVW